MSAPTRTNIHLRDQVERALADIANGGPRVRIIARLAWMGLPEARAMQIFAGGNQT